MGWRVGQRFINPETGETAPENPTVIDLLELLIGRPIATRSKPRTSADMLAAGWARHDMAADLAKWGAA